MPLEMRGRIPVILAIIGAVILSAFAAKTVGAERENAGEQRDRIIDRSALGEIAHLEASFDRVRYMILLTARNSAFVSLYDGDVSRAERIADQYRTAQVREALAYLDLLDPDSVGRACFIDAGGSENACVVNGVHISPGDLSLDETAAIFFAPSLALANGEVHLSVPYRSPATAEWVIASSTPVDSRNGRRLGIVYYEVTLESFLREPVATTGSDQQVRFFDATGTVLIAARFEQRLDAVLGVPDDGTFRAVVGQTEDGLVTAGERRHSVHRMAQSAKNDNRWYVVVSAASSPFLSAAGFSSGAVGAAILALGLVLFAWHSLRRRRAMTRGLAEERERDAEERSRTDGLTGLLNRRGCIEMLTAELRRAEREGHVPGVLLVDADRFKRVNDTYGHQAGDAVLVEVARRLRSAVREYDVVARWGGEEFVVVVPAMSNDADLATAGHALLTAISATPIAAGPDLLLPVTISVGGVRAGDALWSVEGIVDAADRALYSAKHRGRNRVRLFTQMTVEDFVAEEPEAMRLAQVLALSAAVREGMPELHSQQVADLSGEVARAYGLSEEAVLRCRLGGWLHDVGKIAIPDRILAKPGALDDDEWAVMHTHSVIGELLVSRVDGLAEAAPAVRHHHERVDGTGYPDGLAGDAIPIEARIIAAADAYSAITVDRPYRRSRSQQIAIEELRESVGTHLDGDVVEALVRALDRRESDVAANLLRG